MVVLLGRSSGVLLKVPLELLTINRPPQLRVQVQPRQRQFVHSGIVYHVLRLAVALHHGTSLRPRRASALSRPVPSAIPTLVDTSAS